MYDVPVKYFKPFNFVTRDEKRDGRGYDEGILVQTKSKNLSSTRFLEQSQLLRTSKSERRATAAINVQCSMAFGMMKRKGNE